MATVLRPLNTGEVLDRAFNLYRNNFLLLAGISVLPPLLALILNLLQMQATVDNFNRLTAPDLGGAPEQSNQQVYSNLLLVIAYLLGLVVSSAATVYAVSMVYLDKKTSILRSYRGILPRFLRLLGIVLMMAVVFVGLAIVVVVVPVFATAQTRSPIIIFGVMLAGVLVLVHLYVCLSVATSACVIEDVGVFESLNRSMTLTRGSRGRIWLVFLLTIVLQIGLFYGMLALIGAVYASTHSFSTALLVNFVVQFLINTLLAPILTVPLVLIYFDQRVRKEAFDLEIMMDALGQRPDQAAAAAPMG